jgi:uroporphyrinogen decarboxylase
MLSYRERILTIINHDEADRVAYQVSYVPEVNDLLKKKYIKKISEFKNENTVYDESIILDEILGHDMLFLNHGICLGYYKNSSSDKYVDKWNIEWKKTYYDTINGKGYYTEIVKSPLAEDSLVDSYLPPDPFKEDLSHTERIIKKYSSKYFLVANVGSSVFEGLRYLRGFTQSMIDLIACKDIARRVMDVTVDYHIKLGIRLINLGIDMLYLADDYAAQNCLLMSEDTFREMCKPKMAYMIQEFKKANKDIKIAFHSCGNVRSILDDIIETGVDVLNPVQPEAVNPAELKKRYGKKLVLWGGLSNQKTMPNGKPDDIKKEMKNLISNCAPGGGFILSPAHNVQLDAPIANIEAFYECINDCGRYPLNI